MKKKRFVYGLAVLCSSVVISSCGGGGGGVTQPTTTQPQPTTTSVSGTVVEGSTQQSTTQALTLRSQQGNEPIRIANALITVSSSLGDKKELVTDENGNFIIPDLKVSPTNGWIKITVQKDGYTRSEKVINYKDYNELKNLNLQTILDKPDVKSINVAQGLDLKQTTSEDTFVSIAVVKDVSTGKQEVLSGQELKYQLRKNSNLVTVWQLDINKQLLKQQGTESVIATIKNYDPSKPEDMQRFPAENDDKGNKLITAGFDFVNIVDQDGKTFELKKQTTSQNIKTNALPSNYKIKRLVDSRSILCDENSSKSGTQIGFYWFTNNSWVKIGEATIYCGDGDNAYPVEYDKISQCNSKLYAVLTDSDINESALPMDRYYNLDYVTTSCGAPKTITLKLNVKDDKGNPVSAYGYYTDGGFYNYIASNRDNTITIPNNFDKTKLVVYDPFEWRQISSDKIDCPSQGTNTVECNITVQDPYSTTITGKLVDENGKPMANRYIYTSQGKYAQTKNDGSFTFKAKSGNICIYAYPKIDALTCININDGKDKNLGNLVYKNSPPVAYLWVNSYVINQGKSLDIYYSVYDPDYDNYTIKFSSDCGGTFSPSDTNPTTWTAPNTAGECKITLTATDSNGGKTEKTITITVKSPQDNLVISSITASSTAVDFGKTVSLSAVVLYYDTGNVKYNWTDDCGGTFSSSNTNPTTWTAPNTPKECNITFTASVGTTIQKTRQIKIIVGKTAYGNITIQKKN